MDSSTFWVFFFPAVGPTGSASTLCQAIAEALKLNRTIVTIHLDFNAIGDPGAEAWRRAGRTCGGRIEKCEEQSAYLQFGSRFLLTARDVPKLTDWCFCGCLKFGSDIGNAAIYSSPVADWMIGMLGQPHV